MLIPLLPSILDDSKDPGYFAPQAREFRRQDRFAHAPLDAVALHGLTQNAPSSQPNARTIGRSRSPIGKKICHATGKVFAAPLVHALIVSVFAQPRVVLHWKPHPIGLFLP